MLPMILLSMDLLLLFFAFVQLRHCVGGIFEFVEYFLIAFRVEFIWARHGN
jgi:hypothetical protein